jgi:hypothetical protein
MKNLKGPLSQVIQSTCQYLKPGSPECVAQVLLDQPLALNCVTLLICLLI